jgi:hypothetical protein
MNNLQKIQKIASSVRDNLANLKPSSALDDLDTIARERTLLREKLNLLADAESSERERLEAEDATAKAKLRHTLLLNVAKSAEVTGKQYDNLTTKANTLVAELIAVLAKRENVFTRKAVGINHDLYALLTAEEQSEVLTKLDRSKSELYPGNFSNTWREAVNAACGGNNNLRIRLRNLVNEPNHPAQNTPLAGSRPLLVEAARYLAETQPAVPTTNPVALATEPEGERYAVDIRDPKATVENINAH